MFEEETVFQNLTQNLAHLEGIIYSLRQETQNLEDYQPDAAEDAIEKLETAMEQFDEAKELVAECRIHLSKFLDQAAVAAHMYDRAQANSNSAESVRDAEKAKSSAEKLRGITDRYLEKLSGKVEKVKISVERASSKVNVAQIKAKTQEERDRNKKVRINFTLPEHMKDDWKGLSDELGISVSEMIRDAMSEFKQGIKSLDGLDQDLAKMGTKLGKVGTKIGNYVQDQVEKSMSENPYRQTSTTGTSSTSEIPHNPYGTSASQPSESRRTSTSSRISIQEKDSLKKRITGLIRIQNCLPIDKLAQALVFTLEQAENLIYELAAEGIDGKLEAGIFKYKNKPEEVIEAIHEFIDRM